MNDNSVNKITKKNNYKDDFTEISIEELLYDIDNIEEGQRSDGDKYTTKSLVEIDNTLDDDYSYGDLKSSIDNKNETSSRIMSVDIIKSLIGWAKLIVIAVVIAILLNIFVVANAVIPTGSMESTIMTGDRVMGCRLSYLFSGPDRGDVIIFKYPDDESVLFIKRVIGLPGDEVEIRDGLVYINDSDEPLDEPYLSVTPKGNFGPYQIPEDSYFVLGDNRNVSKDSRLWENTFVHKDKIIAKALFRYYPSFGFIK